MVRVLNFSALVVLGFSLYLGYAGYASVMVAGLTASVVLLFFANLDKISEFKASATGFEARTKNFVATLPSEAKASLDKGTLGDPREYAPFRWSEQTSAPNYEALKNDILKSNLSDFLASIDEAELLALHAWYNEENKHSLALQAICLAIAKKQIRSESAATASKNYSFASASLRKSFRLDEAEAFASLAVKLNPNNLDAEYNLALINKQMGNIKKAEEYARKVMNSNIQNSDIQYYSMRLQKEFPDLSL